MTLVQKIVTPAWQKAGSASIILNMGKLPNPSLDTSRINYYLQFVLLYFYFDYDLVYAQIPYY